MQDHKAMQQETKSESKEETLEASPEPLNVRIMQSLEETINQVRDAVAGQNQLLKDAVNGQSPVGNAVNGEDHVGNVMNEQDQKDPSPTKSILQTMEDKIVESVHSVEETLVQSVQSMKEAVSGATEAAKSSAAAASAPSVASDESKGITEVDEASILVNSVIQD